MLPVYIDPLIDRIRRRVEAHNLGATGAYSRWIFGDGDLGVNEYGCADAANILYMIGDFPRDPEERAAWIRVLQGMQDPETGLFQETTHHPLHTTAHCIAALELFDAAPLYPLTALMPYAGEDGVRKMLEEEVDWQKPWPESHKGAGILVCLGLTGTVGQEWIDRYFDWLWENSDPEIGFFFHGDQRRDLTLHYMGGGFHYMFNHEYYRRPYRYPEKIIDTCLALIADPANTRFNSCCGFIDIDVVFSLTRAMRQTVHRFDEVKEALERYAERFLEMMNGLDDETDFEFNDLHSLFGSVCCLAELQVALPGKIRTLKPLKLVLDRRPFI